MIVLHHLASSGGTVFSKALSAQRNCALVNEAHPYFSTIPEAGFSPTTPLEQYLARYRNELHQDAIAEARQELFRFQLHFLHGLVGNGKKLLLREWSHGDFFATARFSSSTLPLLDFVDPVSLVLLRHPVDCFLSGKTYNAWNPIKSDIDEFCRRYIKFHEFFRPRAETLFVKYEDFAADPDGFLKEICAKLGLIFNPDYMQDLNRFRLSGASGRTSYEKIMPRPRRPMSEAERAAFLRSEHYVKVCELGGYSGRALICRLSHPPFCVILRVMRARQFSSDAEVGRVAQKFLDRSLPKTEWTHAAHFAVTLWLIRHRPSLDLDQELPGLIRAFNEAAGTPNTDTGGYHETITRASLAGARAYLAAYSGPTLLGALDGILASPLSNSGWLLDYWSRERLFSVTARKNWVPPDLKTLPYALPRALAAIADR